MEAEPFLSKEAAAQEKPGTAAPLLVCEGQDRAAQAQDYENSPLGEEKFECHEKEKAWPAGPAQDEEDPCHLKAPERSAAVECAAQTVRFN